MISLVISVSVVGIGAAGLINYSANMTHSIPDKREQNLADVTAVTLADRILGSPGHGWVRTGNGCLASQLDAESVTEYGLRIEAPCADVNGRENTLSHEKLVASGGLAMDRSPIDGKVNYAEARDSLGLSERNMNFRVSMEPFEQDLDARILYMGHFVVGGSAGAGAAPTVSASAATSTPKLPTTTTTPSITPAIGLAGPCVACDWAPSEPGECFAADWCWSVPGLVQQSLWWERFCVVNDVPCGALQAEVLVSASTYAHASGPFEPSVAVQREAAYLKEIAPGFEDATSQYIYSGIRMLYSPTGDVIADQSAGIDTALFSALTNINEPGITEDGLRATTAKYNTMVVGSEVVDYAFGSWVYTGVPTPSWVPTPTPALPTPAPPPTLHVQAKQKWGTADSLLYDWVQGGGFLIVLGNQNILHWPEKKFQAWYQTHGSPVQLMLPGEEDALLTTPNDLDWQDYAHPHPDKAWYVLDESKYERLVQRSRGAGAWGDLVRSLPAAFGDGSVVFTTWRPYDLVAGGPPCENLYAVAGCEAVLLFENLIEGMYQRFDFSFGPDPPVSTTSVGSVARVMSVMSQDGLRTMVKVRVHVWSGTFQALTKHTFPFTIAQDPYPAESGISKDFELWAPAGTATFTLDKFPIGATWKVEWRITPPGQAEPETPEWAATHVSAITYAGQPAGTWKIGYTIVPATGNTGQVQFSGNFAPSS